MSYAFFLSYVNINSCLELLTEGVIFTLCSVDFSVPVDPQEKLLKRVQLSPPYVSLEMRVAAHMPSLPSPSPTQRAPGGPGSKTDLSLRNVQGNPEGPWICVSQPVSAVWMAGRPS